MTDLADLDPEQIEKYWRYVSQAKQEARSGNLEASLQLFQQALEIHFSENLTAKIKNLEDALAVEEEDDDGFVDVCQSGLMLYGKVHDKLFDYQREGVAFLYKLYRDRRKGGILADDMELGKTIQVITFLSGMFDAELIHSVLLILPVKLINNWMKEFATWTPGLRVKVFHGTNKAERQRSLEQIQRRKGVLLTTYRMLLNSSQYLSSFDGKEFVWDYIILDEAHKIKSPSAKTTKSLRVIPSKNRILLTGTPVQNNLKELWALFDFACQGSLLGTMETFRMEYEGPITRARAKDATPGEKALGRKISENLMSIIQPYFLRRTTDELQKKKKAELPNHLPENQSNDVAPAMPSLYTLEIFGISDHETEMHETAHDDEAKNEEAHTEHRVQKAQELVQVESQLNDQHIKNIRNTTEGTWLRDTDSATQPKMKPSKSSPGETLGPSTSERTSPTLVESPTQSTRKPPAPPPSPVVAPPVFNSPLVSDGLIDLVSDDDNEFASDMVNLSSKMTSLVVEDMDDEQMLQIISNVEDGLPSEEKEHQFPSFQSCDLNPGTGLVSPFQAHSVSIMEDNSPESRAISEMTAEGTDDEQMAFHTTNTDVLHSKNKECQPTRLQADDQNKTYTPDDVMLQTGTGSELEDDVVKLLQDLFGYSSDDGIHQTQADMSLDGLPISHGDPCEIKEPDAVAPQETMVSKMTESSALQNSGMRETAQSKYLDISSHYQQMRNIRNTTEGTWLRDTDSATQPKMKPSKSSPGETLGPSTSERTSPTLVESPTQSTRKPPAPPPSPVVAPPVFNSPVVSDGLIDLVSDDDNEFASDMVNLSSKMTSLFVEDMDDEQMLQIISNVEDGLPSEEKEHQFPSFQSCDLNPGTGLVSPFQAHSVSIMEDNSPESRAISELAAEGTDDEQMVFDTTNTDVLHSKNKECQPTRLQADDQNKTYTPDDVMLQTGTGSELEDDVVKLLQDLFGYSSDDGIHQTQADMSLDGLPISHGDPCEIKEPDAVAPQETMVSKMTESSTLQNSGMRETAQCKYLDISSHYQQMRNIRNTTEGTWLRDTDSATQPKMKPSKSSPGETLGPSTSERTSPTLVESPTQSTRKPPAPPPSPVVAPPVFNSPVISDGLIDLVSDDDNEFASDMVNLSFKMTSLVVEDMDDEQMLQIISNVEDGLPSEEKEHQFPSFQSCDLNPGTGLVSPFQAHSVSIMEDNSPESRAISELAAEGTDDEQMVFDTTNMDVLHSKNKECQPTRLQADDQNKTYTPDDVMLQTGTGSELEDDVVKLLQDLFGYSDDGIHQTQADMSLDGLPISHGDPCEIKEPDAVAPQETMVSKMTESSALQNSGMRETAQSKYLDISSHYQQMRNIRNTTEGTWLRDTDSATQPKMKPSKSSPGETLGPSTSERTSPTLVESPTQSTRKPPAPPPSPVVAPPVFNSPVVSDGLIDLVSDDDIEFASDMVNLSSKMTILVVEDMDDEQMLQIISNVEDGLPSEEKEHQFPSFQSCDLNPGTGLVSPFQAHSVSIKEDNSPESRAISELAAEGTDDEQMVFDTTNTDVLHSKNKECQPTRLQADDQNKTYTPDDVMLQTGTGSELEDDVVKLLQDLFGYSSDDGIHQTQADMSLDGLPISHGDPCEIKELDAVAPQETMVSKMTESSALQNSGILQTGTVGELKDAAKKLLQDLNGYYFDLFGYSSDDGIHQTQADMSLDGLPISHGDPCEIKELDVVAPQETMVSKMTESSALQNSGMRETAQSKYLDISSHYQQMRNIRNTTEGTWLRDTDSATQPKAKPSKSSPGDPFGPSTSERTSPTLVESPTQSMEKQPAPPPCPVVAPPVFNSPVVSDGVIDLVSDDDNDFASDRVN